MQRRQAGPGHAAPVLEIVHLSNRNGDLKEGQGMGLPGSCQVISFCLHGRVQDAGSSQVLQQQAQHGRWKMDGPREMGCKAARRARAACSGKRPATGLNNR